MSVLSVTLAPVSLLFEDWQVQFRQQCAIIVQSLFAQLPGNNVLFARLVADSLGVRSQEIDQLVEQGLSLKVTKRGKPDATENGERKESNLHQSAVVA